MSNDDDMDELIQFARNQVEGPSLITPRVPNTYHTCKGCKYFSKSMASTGGMRGSPTYYKDCMHPDVKTEHRGGKSLDPMMRSGLFGSREGKEITPDWCPFLKNKAMEVK